MTEQTFTFEADFVGRIGNISLAPSQHNALAPIFEAISNSIQALEERFGENNISQGSIEVEILRSGDDDNYPVGVIVKDNGIGLNRKNF